MLYAERTGYKGVVGRGGVIEWDGAPVAVA